VRKFAIFFLLLTQILGAVTLKIATYNVENLFDLKKSGHEYKEYIPYTKSQWNQKNYKIKLHNIAKVIKDINADIIGLQEIESLQALKDLRFTLKCQGLYYPYFKIANYKQTTIKVAILSKIPFVYTHEIAVQSSYKYRNILEAKFRVKGEEFFVLVNHWKAKSGPESMRIVSAQKLKKRVKELGKDKNIILLGDFNSHYEENLTFIRKRRLNNTNGVTGINDILGTKKYKKNAYNTKPDNYEFYNLWYDTDVKNRWTYIFRGKKEALDSILVSASLLNKKGMRYQVHSIESFHKAYVFKRKGINRWQTSRKNPRVHKGKGYSDHLGVMAKFVIKI
jgi:predicted extracellular nuclease